MYFSQTKSVAASLALTSVLLAMSSTAFAQNKNALTHDQVRAEYVAARMAGTLVPHGDAPTAMAKASPSTLTREAVVTEFFAARAAGKLVPKGDAPDSHTASK